MGTSAQCIFCDLIRGAAEVSVCYEDARAIAFMDIQPVNAGHVLVVPKSHYATLHDLPHDVAMHLFDVAMRLAPVIRKVAGADDMNIVVNSGAHAGQNIFHYHVHLIPRTAMAMASTSHCRSTARRCPTGRYSMRPPPGSSPRSVTRCEPEPPLRADTRPVRGCATRPAPPSAASRRVTPRYAGFSMR